MSAPERGDARVFYDEMWRSYAHLDAASPAAHHRRRLVGRLAARFAPNAERVLDVGCGPGDLLEELRARLPDARVGGADVSEQSMALAREKNPDADLFLIDLTATDFEARQANRLGSFDLVVCSEVIEHIDDDALAARRLAELLAPGGHLIVTVPGGKMSRFDRVIGHHRHYRPRQLDRLLRSAGLEVERVMAWGFPFHNLYRSAVRVASLATIRQGGARQKRQNGVVSGALGQAYTLFGRTLKPLFYLNLNRWGEQMLAVARRSTRNAT
jgi:trans-aconitate methyltransferase